MAVNDLPQASRSSRCASGHTHATAHALGARARRMVASCSPCETCKNPGCVDIIAAGAGWGFGCQGTSTFATALPYHDCSCAKLVCTAEAHSTFSAGTMRREQAIRAHVQRKQT